MSQGTKLSSSGLGLCGTCRNVTQAILHSPCRTMQLPLSCSSCSAWSYRKMPASLLQESVFACFSEWAGAMLLYSRRTADESDPSQRSHTAVLQSASAPGCMAVVSAALQAVKTEQLPEEEGEGGRQGAILLPARCTAPCAL